MKKIRILQFLTIANIGGTENHVLSLVLKMDRNIFENEVCFLCEEGSLTSILSSLNIKTYHLYYGKKGLLPAVLSFYKILKSGNYDIVHIYGLKANLIGRLVGRFAGCRNIVSGLRNIFPSDKGDSRFHLMLDKLTLPFIKLYISNSKAAIDFMALRGYPKEKFVVVHNGIDCDEFQREPDVGFLKGFLIEKNAPIIITIAHMRPQKAYHILIEALNLIFKKKIPFTSLFVGDGVLKNELIKLSFDLGLSSKIHFLGNRADIPELLSISNIFVLSSYYEGLPRSIMEAMSAKLPVVATDTGGVSELVEDEITGILVPPKDAIGLAFGIEKLLLDEKLRKQMGTAGYKKIKNEFSLAKMVNEIEKVYKNLIVNV